MLDFEQFRPCELPFVYPLYSGYNLFDDNKWHPTLKIKNKWFAITHTESSKAMRIAVKMTGRFYTKDMIRNSYILPCNEPTKLTKRVSGYICINPLIPYFKKQLRISSVEDLKF